MMKVSLILVISAVSCVFLGNAFTPIATPSNKERKLVSMSASKNEGNILQATLSTVGAFLLSTMVVIDDASAMDYATKDLMAASSIGHESSFVISNGGDKMNFGSSELISARSGGRGGGRASMSRPMSRPSSSSYSRPTTTIRSNTYVAPTRVYSSPIMISPFGSPFGYGYGGGGFGLGYGLGALSGGAGRVDQRALYEQEKDLAQSKAELEVTKQKEADLEQRIKALEQAGNPQESTAVTQ